MVNLNGKRSSMTMDQFVAAAATAPKAAAPWRSLEEVKQELMRRRSGFRAGSDLGFLAPSA